MKRFLIATILLTMTTLLVFNGCVQPTPAPEPSDAGPLRVRAITSCSKFDYAWGTSNFRAMEMLQNEMGAEISFLDTVAMVDQQKIFHDFDAMGSDLIIGWGYEFLDSANIVAPDVPDTPFSVTCAPHPGSEGYASNLASLYFTEEEAGYLAGVLAASITETKKIGFISGTDIPCVAKTLNAFRLGVYDTDPDVEVEWSYTGSWADVAKERELATALVDLGCDVLFPLWIGLATADVCEEKNIYAIGSQYLSEYKPDLVVADHFINIIEATRLLYEDVVNQEFRPVPYQITMDRGLMDLVVNEALVPSVVSNSLYDEIKSIKQSIVGGDLGIPRLVRVLPPEWPHSAVSDYEEYLEPSFENIYGYDQYGYPPK